MPTLFTRIISGELPSYRIHEDDLTYSFLALDQVNLGHTLIIPKKEVDHWFDVPPDIFTRVQINAQRIARAIKKATNCPRVGCIVAGFEVNHYHLHMIPAWSIPDLSFTRAQRKTAEEMSTIQASIIKHLEAI